MRLHQAAIVEDFAGTRGVLAVDSLMSKVALFAVAGFLGLSMSLPAQQMQDAGRVQPVRFTLSPLGFSGDIRSAFGGTDLFGTLNNAWHAPAPLTFADGRRFSFPSAFAWMEAAPTDFLPAVALEEPPRVTPTARLARDSSNNKALDLLPKFDYAGGEVGIFYGKSNGKFSREVEAGYIFGEVVDGNTHISVGASYEHSNGRVPSLLGR
jgi:hypothetical protein